MNAAGGIVSHSALGLMSAVGHGQDPPRCHFVSCSCGAECVHNHEITLHAKQAAAALIVCRYRSTIDNLHSAHSSQDNQHEIWICPVEVCARPCLSIFILCISWVAMTGCAVAGFVRSSVWIASCTIGLCILNPNQPLPSPYVSRTLTCGIHNYM